ncbi:30417_t:CDS:2, partial [Gigaspora margarita]
KSQEFVTKHEYRLKRIGQHEIVEKQAQHSFVKRINNINVTLFHPVIKKERKIIRITEEETATYLLYVIILQNYPKINIALQLANRSTQNRNQLENAFVVYGIKELMTYGRFSENYTTGYVRQVETFASTGQAATPHCRWSTEFIMRVLAI